jgi:hypothetical protein
MGNCPSEFAHAPGAFGCIMKCPAGKGFELTTTNGYSCTYKEDPDITFPLIVAPVFGLERGGDASQSPPEPTSYKNLPNAKVYEEIAIDFQQKLKVALAKIDKIDQAAAAFERLQDAEEVRDEAPDAYEKARVDYYTLTKGETWIEDEKKRIANTEAQPTVDNYLNSYSNLVSLKNQQQQTIDAVNGVKDNVIGVTDDMKFSVAAFGKQLTEIKNQIQLDKKKKIIEAQTYSSWFDLILNILIAMVTCVAIFFVARAVMARVSASAPITPPTT